MSTCRDISFLSGFILIGFVPDFKNCPNCFHHKYFYWSETLETKSRLFRPKFVFLPITRDETHTTRHIYIYITIWFYSRITHSLSTHYNGGIRYTAGSIMSPVILKIRLYSIWKSIFLKFTKSSPVPTCFIKVV